MIGGVGINPMLGSMYPAQKQADDPKVQEKQSQLENTAARPETSPSSIQKPVQAKDEADEARLEDPQLEEQKKHQTDANSQGISIYA